MLKSASLTLSNVGLVISLPSKVKSLVPLAIPAYNSHKTLPYNIDITIFIQNLMYVNRINTIVI